MPDSVVLQKVTVFMDGPASRDFESGKLSPRDILETANRILGEENQLPFRYDLEDIQIRKWERDSNLDEAMEEWPDSKAIGDILIFEAEEVYRENRDFSRLSLFFSGCLNQCSGASYQGFMQNGFDGARGKLFGSGFMVVGSRGPGLFSRFFSNILGKFFPDARAGPSTWIGAVVAHEQAHLYGVGHADDPNSLMYPFYTSALKLDPFSRGQFEEAIREEMRDER